MIGGAAMDQVFLPGTIRDRIKDLMRSKKMTQAKWLSVLEWQKAH